MTKVDNEPTIVDAAFPTHSAEIDLGAGSKVLASRYEILGLLGTGGMGTVYRARDRELDELVALKVLKHDVAGREGMLERFRREVKLARRVTHRNVARVFDIGEDGGDRFLTMELVEGEALSVRAAGKMSPARTIAVARDVLGGLAASHDAGVVHGDLKPENVILAKNERAVITDFGIARALESDKANARAGSLVGTPAYMAPEQVEGAADIDGRADLYALGCMMFRLLTGEHAWGGGTFVAVAAARLLKPPPDPRSFTSDVPADLAELVVRLMAKSRDDRFSTARDALAALDNLAGDARTTGVLERPVVAARPKAVAVLPIVNKGAEADDYLASGLTEDLIDVLSGVPGLRVRPRGAAAAHAENERDAQRAGRALEVDVVVEGSLRHAGDLLRAHLRVVTVNDGFQLWAKRFERPAAAFFAIGDEAASEIASVLASQKVESDRRLPSDATALDLYLRGRYIFVSSYFDIAKAVVLLQAAHERAPQDPRIAGMYALGLMRLFFHEPQPESVAAKGREIARAAIERDATVGEARVALALAHSADNDPASMVRELHRALVTSPDSGDALLWLANVNGEVGRPEEGLRLFWRAQAADPSFGVVTSNIARMHALLGDWDAADVVAYHGTNKTDMLMSWMMRARLNMWRGDRVHAERLLLAAAEEENLPAVIRARVANILIVTRDRRISPEMEQLMRIELAPVQNVRRTLFNVQLKSELLCRGGRFDEARAALLELDRLGFLDLTWLERCPVHEPIRSSPEYAQLHASTLARAQMVQAALDEEL